MLFRMFPFARALDNDRFYTFVFNDRADLFWKEHSNTGTLVNQASDDAKTLIFAMLQAKPELRPSLNEVLNSEWFQNTDRMTPAEVKTEFERRKANIG